ncbi:chloride channel protein [Halarchaeum acidiphilum]|uniref:chloride channel protein n=1 Tax=Halarchaeum acidiphilum TaxID=489138 RepID=UPI00131EDF1C|nr:chloride channel protein [Halarchaeum acidiphilum]
MARHRRRAAHPPPPRRRRRSRRPRRSRRRLLRRDVRRRRALLDRADPPLPARTTLAGLGIGLLGWVLPLSYFYGASKMPTLLAGDRTPLVLVATLLACMIAAGLTIKGGWLGGLIVPHMFMGAIVGKIAALLVPGVGPVVAMLAAMAAFNAVVTGTPLSSALIAISLTDGAAIVPVFLASIAGFVASPYVEFLETAATRHEQPNFHLDD